MIKKTENCLYCGEKMESKTAKKKFCSDLHRVYWNRERAYKKHIDEVLGTPEFKKLIITGQPELPKSTKHPLWKENDPKEGSMAFFLKYGCNNYSELENKAK